MDKKSFTMPDALSVIFICCLLAAGLFFEYLAAGAAAVLAGFIVYRYIRTGRVVFRLNLLSVAVAAAAVFYALSPIWALDRGTSVYGLVRFLPTLLFLLCLQQSRASGDIIKLYLPYAMAFMGAVSAIGAQLFPSLFLVNGRLSGFLQYPNTFAILLLLSLILIFSKQKIHIYDWVCAAVLAFCMLYSGSRTVLLLAALTALLLPFVIKDKRTRVIYLIALGGALVLAAVLVFAVGGAFSRILSVSLSSSTFVGRLLYWQDAIPVILKHPLGLGYGGYYYIQQSAASGVYSVMYAHNGLLELMLDIGWLPALLLYAAFIKPLLRAPRGTRLLLLIFILHTLFDFDLQFAAVFMLLTVFCDEGGREIKLSFLPALSALVAAVCLYFGAAHLAYTLGSADLCHAMYPAHTANEVARLTAMTDGRELDAQADRILGINRYVGVAYSAKARYAYSQGDFLSLIKYKNELFEIAPFCYTDMEEYCYMLIHGISLYTEAGDDYSAGVCRDQLKATVARVAAQSTRLSTLGRLIGDQPQTELPADITGAVQ